MREPTVREIVNAQLTENLLEAENSGDYDRLFSVVAADARLHAPVVAVGRDAIRAHATAAFSAFPDHQRVAHELRPSDDYVVVRWTFSGTHLGAVGPIRPSGQRVTLDGTSVLQFVDLRLVGAWSYFDETALARQLGPTTGTATPLVRA